MPRFYPHCAIYVGGVSGCRIERNEIEGEGALPTAKRGNGIHLWKTKQNQLIGNRIRNKRDGLYFSYADNNLIAGNAVRKTRFGIHYMDSHQNRLLSNNLSANPHFSPRFAWRAEERLAGSPAQGRCIG